MGISHSSYYYQSRKENDERDIVILKAIQEVLERLPFYGYRKVWRELDLPGVTEKQVRRIMKRAGLKAIYPGKRTTIPVKWHTKYPYLLKDKAVWLPNQVWAADITYITVSGGHVYLMCIIDVYSRKILSWRLSNTLDAAFCVSALEEAMTVWGIPAIFNTDQGCQFTSQGFIDTLTSHGVRVSMDGKNRALDNIYIERFWRSLKYEDIYLNDYQDMASLKAGLKRYVAFYNGERFHASLGYLTPDEQYFSVFTNGQPRGKPLAA